jgi:hypothetical protein
MTKDEAKKLVLTVRMALEALENDTCVAAIEAKAEILKLVAQPVQPVGGKVTDAEVDRAWAIASTKDMMSYALQDFIANRVEALAQPEQDGSCKYCVDGCIACDARAQPPLPAQEPVACARCKDLEEQAYDLLGKLKVANLKWSVAHPWVGLTNEEVDAAWGTVAWHSSKGLLELRREYAQAIEQALKEKNT